MAKQKTHKPLDSAPLLPPLAVPARFEELELDESVKSTQVSLYVSPTENVGIASVHAFSLNSERVLKQEAENWLGQFGSAEIGSVVVDVRGLRPSQQFSITHVVSSVVKDYFGHGSVAVSGLCSKYDAAEEVLRDRGVERIKYNPALEAALEHLHRRAFQDVESVDKIPETAFKEVYRHARVSSVDLQRALLYQDAMFSPMEVIQSHFSSGGTKLILAESSRRLREMRFVDSKDTQKLIEGVKVTGPSGLIGRVLTAYHREDRLFGVSPLITYQTNL